MYGILLLFLGIVFLETGTVVGKKKALQKKEGIYTMGFLNMFWAAIFFFLFALFVRGEFVFDMASLPTLAIRTVLEIVQAHVTMKAIIIADRTTYSFLRIWTIPLLLLVDIVLGYALSFNEILGIVVILAGFFILFMKHGIRKKGMGYVLFTSINAVITISLFKYNITNFNSLEVEQGIISLILIAYFYIMARVVSKERPLVHYMRQPIYFFQSFSMGIAALLLNFAYLFAAPSVITAGKRSFTLLASIASGNLYFHEHKPLIKILSSLLVIAGVVLFVI